jgi:hypothetical protein
MFALMIIGYKGDLSDERAQDVAQSIARVITAMKPQDLAEFAIHGFDDDPREIWDIPEARDYFIAFANELTACEVDLAQILPQTLDTITACFAARAGRTITVRGTVADSLREGVEQVLQHVRKHTS